MRAATRVGRDGRDRRLQREAIGTAIAIAISTDGGSAKHAAEDAERSAREDDGAVTTPSSGIETGRAAGNDDAARDGAAA